MVRIAIVVIVSSFCMAGVGHAAPDSNRKPASKSRRHRSAKDDDDSKTKDLSLAEKIEKCGNDPLCGTGM